MFTLARQAGKIYTSPYIPALEEHNARQGFFDHAGFLALRESLPEYLRDPITFLYYSGWRRGEMRTLEWRDVDLEGRVVRLRPEVAKNNAGRLLPLTIYGDASELLEVFQRAHDGRRPDCPFVFQLHGRPIGDFRKAWNKAISTAGLAGRIPHDFRRTAVRNLVRAGVPEQTAMAITGHKTRSIFDRYNIVDEADLADAMVKLQTYVQAQPRWPKVASLKPAQKQAPAI